MEEFAEALEGVTLKDLPTPAFPLPLVEAHLSRQLNAQLLGRVEEKVHQLTTPPSSTAASTTSLLTS